MTRYLQVLIVGILFVLAGFPLHSAVSEELAASEPGHEAHQSIPVSPSAPLDHMGHMTVPSSWEGSQEGVAYSERNHHIAGWLVLLMGFAELSHALRLPSLSWARLLLPVAMTGAGLFLTVWSDHEAWPIGPLSFTDTFWGTDHEIVQHKTYGFLALFVGAVELLRRIGMIGHAAWAVPLPLMAIVGGLMLFGHSHGAHPSAAKITLHHAIMGTLAVTAGSSKMWSSWVTAAKTATSKWELIWAVLILAIGLQLLLYSE